ncbi:PREDICTED: serine protease inhibitor dipetalogastin-like [Nicrophorus vespilloides]|uniref:Serine protease inhibitor dipetalogastin-like n=1 Tax=Nicrophorus vespilloides TaxID=110193 RepID=A0ABM1MWC4_NICVS|nr:PREDICTED: serine protease inhibitor dipetalogastin-like [Nicrophorus vespilloides]
MKTIVVLLFVVAAAVAHEPCRCFQFESPVCGSDGRTYGHECFLKCEQRTNSALTFAYRGKCLEHCSCTKEYNPVCGTDAVTYHNLCLFGCARENDAYLHKLYDGPCKIDHTP